MNSVFSAFKANKSDKNRSSILGTNKKIPNVQENSYENLRHIREIGSTTKIMSSVVKDNVEADLLNVRNIIVIKPINEIDNFAVQSSNSSLTSLNVCDHVFENAKPISLKSEEDTKTDSCGLRHTDTNNICCRNESKNCDNLLKKPYIEPQNLTTIKNENENKKNTCRCNASEISIANVSNTEHHSKISSSKLNINTNSSPVKSLNSNICNVSSSNDAISIAKSSKGNSVSKNSHLCENDIVILNDDDEQEKSTVSMSNELQAIPLALKASATTTPKTSRYLKPRLSISGGFSNNKSMPSVHGRQIVNNNGNTFKGAVVNNCQPKRLSTHQRNLSLDFRSMGILLPPISQVTNTRINLTQHHRNRSLDSALQRIPEASVEVSSPNADNETTFCTSSILNSTMCSKVTLSSTFTSTSSTATTTINKKNDIIASNVINLPSPKAKLCSLNGAVKSTDNKKREDLTSLGSDDSGIICGSESDQVSLNRIRQSHDSLDSAEMEPEEESIDILETTSMDEDYRILKSELCFYQTPEKDLQMLHARKRSNNVTKNIDNVKETSDQPKYQSRNILKSTTSIESNKMVVSINIDDVPSGSDESADVTPTPQEDTSCRTITPENIAVKKNEHIQIESKSEHIKNEVLFKTLFGATKNAIFRTAQSIIDNHEKKNAAKNKVEISDVKAPSENTKKKEFFVLKSSNKKSSPTLNNQEVNYNNNSVNVTPPSTSPLLSARKIEVTSLTKSNSNSSLNKLKVPGVVKCFVTEKNQCQSPTKTEKGPNGLLRFFESPVFNIHFAIHYLFYSKEPGVLSFIGNKIFSFPDQEVDLYIPQLIVMYTQMDELAEVLDPYLTIRCRKSVDFSLKCMWLLEAYNYQIDMLSSSLCNNKKVHLALMKEIFSKKERKQLKAEEVQVLSPIKKTHHRSQSDAVVLLNDSRRYPSSGTLSISSKYFRIPGTPAKLCLGDLTSGRAYDNGCICFESVRGTVNDLLGHKTVCSCGAPKNAPQKEFMKALINIGKNLTTLQTKAEKTSALRMFLNLINKNLPARVWLPLHSDIPHHIVRITEEKTAVLNSKDKTPYIIYVEVVEVCDIYSSPVILKMMPSLRHTKSEEHLESKDSSSSNIKQKLKISESSSCSDNNHVNEFHLTEDDVWSQEDDAITAQYINLHKICERDTLSQMSLDSCDSRDQGIPTLFNIGDVRTRHCNNLNCENTKPFSNDPEDPSAAALKEPWHEKEKLIRDSSPYGHLSNWRLLSAIVKCGDDLRQELMATQLLQMFKIIWQEESVELWVRPYKIVCLSNDSGLIEPILNTVSLHQIKKNSNKSLRDYFMDEYGDPNGEKFQLAQKNFVQSCAAYCLISYLLQVKDRHNGNILMHSDGHLIHIDFGFILSISPKNLGFEQSPFKLTPEFVEVMGGTTSELWAEFNHLLLKGLMAARKHMDRIINLVEIMRSNAQLPCFKNGCSGTVQNLRKRFHMNLTEQELERKVEQLVQDSLKSLSTKLYDGYQYFTNGIL